MNTIGSIQMSKSIRIHISRRDLSEPFMGVWEDSEISNFFQEKKRSGEIQALYNVGIDGLSGTVDIIPRDDGEVYQKTLEYVKRLTTQMTDGHTFSYEIIE